MDGSLITLKEVSYCYPSGSIALDKVELQLPKGKKIALLGANGAGKSTLILLLNGILKPSIGRLFYENKPYSYKKKDLRELRSRVGIIFQESDNQLIAPTVYEEISFGLCNMTNDKELIRKKVDEIIKQFGLDSIKNKSPHQLSTGQKKMVCLASVLVMEPELLVCDEPSSSLDAKHTQLTYGYLDSYLAQGNTVLISTHDVNRAYSWADYVIVMKKGNVLCIGTPKEVFSNKALIDEAELNQPFLVEMAQAASLGIEANDLPSDIDELQQLLIPVA